MRHDSAWYKRPAIEQRVELRLGCPHADHRQPLVPRADCIVDRRRRGGRRAVSVDQRARVLDRSPRRRAGSTISFVSLGIERDRALQRRARIVTRSGRAGESLRSQRRGRREIAVPSDEVIAARGVAGDGFTDPRERHARREVGREEILREQRARDRVVARVQLMPRLLVLGAERPFDVAGERESSSRRAAIRDAQSERS